MVVALRLGSSPELPRAGTSPLAELMACLHVLAEPDHHPDARSWVEHVFRAVPETLRSELYRFAPLWARYRARVFLPMGELDLTLDEELVQLHRMDAELFLPFTVDAITGRSSGRERALALATSPTWARECERRSFARGDLAYSLVHNAQQFRDDLVGLLHGCASAFFDEEWQRSRPLLDSSAKLVRSRLKEEPVLDVVVSLSEMASSRDTIDTVYFDKLQHDDGVVDAHGLILVPSLRAQPHVILKLDDGVPKVMHYLVRPQGGAESASQELLRRRLQVLSEPVRWELCRHLLGESITTSELTVRMGVSKFSASRHLRVLREAGLISSDKEGRQVFHRLNASVILRMGPDVLEAILR